MPWNVSCHNKDNRTSPLAPKNKRMSGKRPTGVWCLVSTRSNPKGAASAGQGEGPLAEGVVCKIPCADCNGIYIGESGNFKKRLLQEQAGDVKNESVRNSTL